MVSGKIMLYAQPVLFSLRFSHLFHLWRRSSSDGSRACKCFSNFTQFRFGFSLSAEDSVKIYMFSFEGVIWPLEGMPTIMLWFSKFTPVTHTIEAMRCVVSRGEWRFSPAKTKKSSLGWTLMYYKVWFGFVISATWSIGFFTIAAFLFAIRR